MQRELDRLTERTFDVLVIGGGIYGLTIAYDAAQRGLAVALIEGDDFGSGSSFNHLRTIHGGLRYLQTLDLRRALESTRERRTLARIAPHALQPLAFALPLTRSLTRGKLATRAGSWLDRLVSIGRNRDVPPPLRLPGTRVISRAAAIERFPGLRRQGLIGALVWHDYQTVEADRLTFAWAQAAAEHGAILANHLHATALLSEKNQVLGAHARDVLSDGELDVRARVTVNATGAALDSLIVPLGLASGGPLLKAMNLVTTREAGEEALGARTPSGRHLFLVPWRRRALFGTWESDRPASPDDRGASERDVRSFVAELNQAFPSLDLKPDDVSLVHRGIVPATAADGGSVTLQARETLRDHLGEGVAGLLSVAGAKYTTARAAAERITDALLRKLHHPPVPCRTASTALPGGALRDVGLAIAEARRDHDAGLPSDTVPHLVSAYGSRYRDVLDLADGNPDWRCRLAEDSPVIGAQLVWAVRREMALTLVDAVVRRTPLGALGYPGDAAAERAARIVGPELHWSEPRIGQELDRLRQFYAID